MRRTFLLGLSLLLMVVFTVTGVLTYTHLREHAEERVRQLMSARLADMLELLQHEDDSTARMRDTCEQLDLKSARALAEFLRVDSERLRHAEQLQELGNIVGAVRVLITDAQGSIVAAVPGEWVGRKLADIDALHDFAAAAGDGKTEMHRFGDASDARSLQYAGVPRRDAPGLVLLGFPPAEAAQPISAERIAKFTPHFRPGERARIAVFRGGALINKGNLPYRSTELLSIPLQGVSELSFPDGDYFAYAVGNARYRLVALIPTADMYRPSKNTLYSMLLSNLLLFLAMFGAVSYLLQRYVLRGLSRVVESLRRIASGDLNERVEVTDTPEFRRLSSDINAMVDTLRFFGEEERENMNRELELARSIQSAALPGRFPAFPNRPEFDLYAVCVPAMTVSGDFYDFFMPGEDKLHFLVADVSDSGIPAALYMMRCMSLIRSVARSGARPETLARAVNTALCEGQSTGIHLSLFYGCLQVRTGELRFINAGSPQALLQHEGGDYEPLSMSSGPVMGLFDDARYTGCRLQMQPGDRLFLYTEGVTSASDAADTPFGGARLREALGEHAPTVADAPRAVRAALRRFLGEGRELQEDVTMLALEYRGKKRAARELCIAAGEPQEAEHMLSEALEAVFAAPADIAELHATTRAVLAALPPATAVQLSICCDEERAELRLSYAAPRLNPLSTLPPLPLDETHYQVDASGVNQLTLCKRLS